MGGISDKIQFWGPLAATVLVAAAVGTAALTAILLPGLRRHVSARPNIRSSHKTPTPQGGGIAVILATVATIAVAALLDSSFGADMRIGWVCAAAVALMALGLADDVAALPVAPRLLIQIIAVGTVIAALPNELRVVPLLPWWLERVVLLIGGLWFVNAVNFMDGIDWMTVAEVVPLAGGLAVLGIVGALPPIGLLVALALCGAMIGFAPFNRPVAWLFLGDAGSLPIGLLLLWLLVFVAGNGHLAAALLLPLYYLADTGITILRRLADSEAIMTAHRRHYYQRALDKGFSVQQIVARVFVLNLALIALALVTIASPSRMTHAVALAVGCLLVSALLFDFSRRASARID